jgi:hypothetical protein
MIKTRWWLRLVGGFLELVRGAGGDLLWMARGWPPANYIPFLIVHFDHWDQWPSFFAPGKGKNDSLILYNNSHA